MQKNIRAIAVCVACCFDLFKYTHQQEFKHFLEELLRWVELFVEILHTSDSYTVISIYLKDSEDTKPSKTGSAELLC